jgi:hypothetical protein
MYYDRRIKPVRIPEISEEDLRDGIDSSSFDSFDKSGF